MSSSASVPQQPERPSTATVRQRQQQQQSIYRTELPHIHPNLDGTFAQVKVFATPVSLPRPGSAPSFLGQNNSRGNSRSNLHPQYQNQQQQSSYVLNTTNVNASQQPNYRTASSSRLAARSGWAGPRHLQGAPQGTAAFRQNHNNADVRPRSASNNSSRQQRSPSPSSPSSQQSRQQIKGQTRWEHWTNNESPGRAAAEAAHDFEQVYSGQPRDEARERRRAEANAEALQQQQQQSSPSVSPQQAAHEAAASSHNPVNHEAYYRQYEYKSHRPSIPDSHLQVKQSSKFPIRGRALFGGSNSNNTSGRRPSSARSNTSSNGSTNSARKAAGSHNAMPPRKIITAELSALRRKYHQVNEANQKLNGFSSSPNGKGGSGRRGNSKNVSVDPKKMRSQLDNIMYQVNNVGQQQQQNVVDLGSGTTTTNTAASSNRSLSNHTSSSHHPIPAHIQHDNIIRRSSETNKVMRREDKVAKENDRRIRNFRARALVQTATEMQRTKQESELKEISDKLVWAKMKRDAADNELYELKLKLASLC